MKKKNFKILSSRRHFFVLYIVISGRHISIPNLYIWNCLICVVDKDIWNSKGETDISYVVLGANHNWYGSLM